jgi:predicted DNA-binding antitoxin AbrB/MazE fold protein
LQIQQLQRSMRPISLNFANYGGDQMMERVRAVYQNGAFIPQVPFDFPENAEVELTVQSISSELPLISDDEQRAQLLQAIVRNMRNNPIPAQAPGFTREELHARP